MPMDIEALREIEKFFEVSLDLLCIAGPDGYFKRINAAVVRTLGWSESELLGRPFLDFVHPDDVSSTLAEMEKLAAGAATISFENRYRRADGGYLVLAWTAQPDLATGLRYAVGRDVTERKALEETQARLVEELLAAATEIKTLQGLIPMCANCHKVRDDGGFWHAVDTYLSANAAVEISHGICDECGPKLYGDLWAPTLRVEGG